jgi:hypothetical protein
MSLYAYTADPNLSRRFSLGSFGVQKYTFVNDGTVTITGTLTYSQSGRGTSNAGPSGEIVRANLYAFEMEADAFDPENCSLISDVSQFNVSGFLGLCLLGELGAELLGLESVQIASFGTLSQTVANGSASAELIVTGTAGQVFFLAGDLGASAFLGGFVDSRTSLLIEVDAPFLIQPTFAKETFVPAVPPGPSVAIDVMPGRPGNKTLLKLPFVPVTIFGSASFDVLQVDASTLKLGRLGAASLPSLTHVRDTNRDGFVDLTAVFRTIDTGIRCGDTEVELTGRNYLTEPFNGADTIETIRCGR